MIRRAEMKGMASSLLAKLCSGVHRMMEDADEALTAVTEHAAIKDSKFYIPSLHNYVKIHSAFYKSLALVFSSKHELDQANAGEAVGYAKGAVVALDGLEGMLKGMENGEDMAFYLAVKKEIESVGRLARELEADNASIYHERVKEGAFPEGRVLAKSTPFEKPEEIQFHFQEKVQKSWCAFM